VLAGVGGRTIAEAQQRLSDHEYRSWRLYREMHGSLNLGLRIEHAAAVTSLTVNRVNGGKALLADFLPDRTAVAANDSDDSLAQAMKEWR